ncbi:MULTISPECIES: DUF47 domain-containing protein [Paludibacter]|jgi:Phosphate transport regulator (distant homolog of PhoU)|uniref:Phosphate transport regulator n=1 Tax=Paludibacter jiangxiensis TaxID=681398 RepID=A0A161LEV2_9BACT|nr:MULTISPECIES: DUF47 family protein [Paludibacter]MDP4203255.1 DUF47 family protein [Bacteroidota bacterium]MTK54435.1 DUF47 family protein [Paludibacter sp.]GAT63325.1 hypothetical protein PJIAN_3646 [Paludibacter jiangxiensis]
MKSNFFAKLFIPKERVFFDLFEEDTNNICLIAQLLLQLVNEPDEVKRREIKNKMHDVEHANDQVTHKVLEELGRNFITPFDREDVHSLISALDDVTDFIYVAAKSMLLYKVDPTHDQTIVATVDLIHKAAEDLNVAVQGLRDLKKTDQVVKALVHVNSIENHADDLLYTGLERLFDHEKDMVQILKRRDVYYQLETVTDKCEDVCDVIENIMIKYA